MDTTAGEAKTDSVLDSTTTSNEASGTKIHDGVPKTSLLEMVSKMNNRKPFITHRGKGIQNPSLKILTTEDGPKSYKCKFCKRFFKGKIIDHLTRIHKDQPEVEKILSLPKAKKLKGKSLSLEHKLRLQLISNTVREENFRDIIAAPEGETVKTVYRARKNKNPKTLKDFKACPICHGFYPHSTFKKRRESTQ